MPREVMKEQKKRSRERMKRTAMGG